VVSEFVEALLTRSSGSQLTPDELAQLNAGPTADIVPLLIDRFRVPRLKDQDSRALYLLLQLDHFDRVGFLIDVFDHPPEPAEDWQVGLALDLGEFNDPRALAKLIEIVRDHPSGGVRCFAMENLPRVAIALQSDAPLPVLDDVAEQGVGEDGLGFTVRDCARWAAKTIREGLAAKPD
jgi:hypothetical protein